MLRSVLLVLAVAAALACGASNGLDADVTSEGTVTVLDSLAPFDSWIAFPADMRILKNVDVTTKPASRFLGVIMPISLDESVALVKRGLTTNGFRINPKLSVRSTSERTVGRGYSRGEYSLIVIVTSDPEGSFLTLRLFKH